MEKKDLNEALKARRTEKEGSAPEDAHRTKALSPGMLVFRRFIRGKLAIAGSVILAGMVLFSFVGPYLYPYGQTQVFSAYRTMNAEYASAKERAEYVLYPLPAADAVPAGVETRIHAIIAGMEQAGQTVSVHTEEQTGSFIVTEKLGSGVYTVGVTSMEAAGKDAMEPVGTYNAKLGKVLYNAEPPAEGFEEALAEAIKNGETLFSHGGESYLLSAGRLESETGIYQIGDWEARTEPAAVSSVLSFDALEPSAALSDSFVAQALYHMYTDGAFEDGGSRYTVKPEKEGARVLDSRGRAVAEASAVIVRDVSGGDTLSADLKELIRRTIGDMKRSGMSQQTFSYPLPQMGEDAAPEADSAPALVDTEITVTRKPLEYTVTCQQSLYVIDRYAGPSRAHLFGTDGDGMDILARMMAGGRVSLLVGFVVVLLEVLLGVLLGGLAGYFGGWADDLIMRLVDVFYCIPSMPILIILGAMFDAIRMAPYTRLFWLMAVLGFLGWAGIARMVRGQILSLREQDFMVAAEAAGLPVRRRIFRHLLPNVMPQLIVSATMGLGSVILTESTLSFLGLGVKHPMATWGTMINSVARSTETMVKYTHIWIPVGLLICMTVIAFNFVGDGLRDAFDPRMKR